MFVTFPVNLCQVNPSVCGPNSKCTNVNEGYWDGFNETLPNLIISIHNTCTGESSLCFALFNDIC